MKRRILIWLFFVPCLLAAQDTNCQYFNKYIRKGDAALNKGCKTCFEDAINAYNTAMLHCPSPDSAQIARDRIRLVFNKIEHLKDEAERAKKRAIKAQAISDSLYLKAEKLINNFYFFENKYALAYKSQSSSGYIREPYFCYINKEGEEITILSHWDLAEQFDSMGYAKVQRKEHAQLVNYLLDTLGNQYKVAYQLSEWQKDATITALDLSGQNLDAIPAEVFSKPESALKVLLLKNNHLKKLPAAIGNLEHLVTLDLSKNELSELPPEIFTIKTLKCLKLSENQLSALPAEIGNFNRLQSLTLENNRLTTLPAEIGSLKNLNVLILSRNHLASLPPEIGELKLLTTLDVKLNSLKSIPPEIGRLQQLSSLDLRVNQLESLPATIGQLTTLNVLLLSSNQLKTIPSEIWQLNRLQTLGLSQNCLDSLPEKIWRLEKLTRLGISDNNIKRLPKQIAQLKNLTWLKVTGNPELDQQTMLSFFINYAKEIIVTTNQTTWGSKPNTLTLILDQNPKIPSNLWRLGKMTSLNLSNCELNNLPKEVGQLKQLKELNLQNNQLTQLPIEIRQLKNLAQLNLRKNPILPAEQEKIRKFLPACKIHF